jgi:hypothetical protein
MAKITDEEWERIAGADFVAWRKAKLAAHRAKPKSKVESKRKANAQNHDAAQAYHDWIKHRKRAPNGCPEWTGGPLF